MRGMLVGIQSSREWLDREARARFRRDRIAFIEDQITPDIIA